MFRSTLPTLLVSALLAGTGLAADVPSKVVEKTLPLSATGRFVLETYKGRVTITASDREEAVVKATVTPDGSCDDAAELVAKTRIRIEGGGSEVRVVSDYDDLPRFRFDFGGDCASRPFVAYEIRVPRGAALRLKDYKSRVSVAGVAGDVELESYKGEVRLERLAGKLDLETYKGDVRADLERVAPGLNVETYKGDVDLVMPKGSKVDLHEDVGRRGRLESDVEVAHGAPRVSVRTFKGTIRLRTR